MVLRNNNPTGNRLIENQWSCLDQFSLKAQEAKDLQRRPGTMEQSQNPIRSHFSHFIVRFRSALQAPPPASLHPARSSLTGSDSLIGAQLTGFLLGEQEPCGPSASWSEDEQVSSSPPPTCTQPGALLNAPQLRAALV